MQNKLFLVCVIAHVIGDYYFQNNEMAETKNEKIKVLFKHSLFYSIPFMLIWILFENSIKLLIFFIALCVTHLFIDYMKYFSYKLYLKIFNSDDKKNKIKKYIKQWMVYIFDQILHLSTIIFIVMLFEKDVYYPRTLIYDMYISTGINGLNILRWILILLCMFKPANITFKILFSNSKPQIDLREYKDNLNVAVTSITTSDNNLNIDNIRISNSDTTDKNINNGAIIGFLERIIIATFLYINEYSAIGFILTAKSIARYNKISDNEQFGEYYLIGTLFSTLFVIVMYHFIF